MVLPELEGWLAAHPAQSTIANDIAHMKTRFITLPPTS
jgi:hypothetical protein